MKRQRPTPRVLRKPPRPDKKRPATPNTSHISERIGALAFHQLEELRHNSGDSRRTVLETCIQLGHAILMCKPTVATAETQYAQDCFDIKKRLKLAQLRKDH